MDGVGTEALHRLEEDLAELNALDPDTVTDEELTELTVGLARCRSRLLAAGAHVTAAWERRGVHRSDGSKAAWARLARTANLSPREAQTIVRHAKVLHDKPATADALARGDISGGHLDLLAAAASNDVRRQAFAGDESFLLQHCVTMRFAEAKRVVHYWTERVDPDGCERVVDANCSTRPR